LPILFKTALDLNSAEVTSKKMHGSSQHRAEPSARCYDEEDDGADSPAGWALSSALAPVAARLVLSAPVSA